MVNISQSAFEILLLEDEPANAYLIETAFKRNKIKTNLHHVMNGCEGLAFLKRQLVYLNAPRPDLILSDLNMPLMNGYEFLTLIKADDNLKNIPVVILSSSEIDSDILKAYQLGAAGYLSKSVEIGDFIRSIERLEDYWLNLVRLPIGKKR